ncbi:hypothetical protein AC249_AIPGENE2554 [Exaiptasia diaphana]|nr:hypothetical protein AC249_AIPGENE2554 [Exaiptasia diaphana]
MKTLECAHSTNSSYLSETVLKVFQKVDRRIPDEEDDDVEPLDMLFYRLFEILGRTVQRQPEAPTQAHSLPRLSCVL